MNDRELLELAAKAAGLEGGWGERVMIGDDEVDLTDIWFLDSPDTCAIWDPLEDDGDALRLAIKLDIHVKRYAGATTAQELCGLESVTEHDHWPAHAGCAMSATRRAIVRAAAYIGRAMP